MPKQSRRRALQATGPLALAGAATVTCSTEDGTNDKSSSDTSGTGRPGDITQTPNGVEMEPGYARTMGATAYLWGWPMVNMVNRRAAMIQVPEPALLGGVVPVAPRGHLAMLSDYVDPNQTFVACPNEDVVYGLANFALDEQPVIVQVPDFGDRFWVYAMYDNRTDQFGELGKQYGTNPGFYLVVGPNWDAERPDGVEAVITAPTPLANAVPRIFMDDTAEDRKAIQSVINGVNIYPLSDFDGTVKTAEWAKLPTVTAPASNNSDGETKWVAPEKFFDQLGGVLDTVKAFPAEVALYGQFRALLDNAKRDADIKKALDETAAATEDSVIAPFLRWKHNGLPAGNGWNHSTNNAAWGVDYFNRTGTAKSNIFENRAAETVYFYTDHDSAGGELRGAGNYEVTFAAGQEPPVQGFWSLTLYNEQHFFHPNDLKRYSRGTKNKTLKRNVDGSLTLYAGATSPGPDKESNWLPAPKGAFSLYIRAYWADDSVHDGSWKPPMVKVV